VVLCIGALVEEERAEPNGLDVLIVFGNGRIGDGIAGQSGVSICSNNYKLFTGGGAYKPSTHDPFFFLQSSSTFPVGVQFSMKLNGALVGSLFCEMMLMAALNLSSSSSLK
ncbi:MAG: hypothetical protein LQ349_009292, partial [Xanthoria aureola]